VCNSRAPPRASAILVNKEREGCGVAVKRPWIKDPRWPSTRSVDKGNLVRPLKPSIDSFHHHTVFMRGSTTTTTTTNIANTNNTVSSRRALRKQKHMLPYERLEFRLDEASRLYGQDLNGNDVGYMIVQPVDMPELADKNNGNKDNDEDEERRPSKAALKRLTQEQVDCFRCIFMPHDRVDALEEMEKLILGDQYGQKGVTMFGTNFSHQVVTMYNTRFKVLMARSARQHATSLNLLLGMTLALRKHDAWMHDYEVGFCTRYGSKMIKSLAAYWKQLLSSHSSSHSDAATETTTAAADLGILDDFTLPGLHAFLGQFKKIVEDIETYDEPPYEFNYAE
jgi:hypothetical protein